MLKKIFSIALMLVTILFFAKSSALAAENFEVMNVAIIMEPPLESFEKPEKVSESIQQTLSKIFNWLNWEGITHAQKKVFMYYFYN